ncbi:treslin [Sorex araneus]|uniref:treslin n=1 Tax=Sorex araneus TaxID=42254 RepID=UPI002433D73E|nr:treslin [Sorex araneus]
MAGCHNVMLLLDAAGGAADPSRLRRTALRLLTYLSGRWGLARLRWAFKLFDSRGARGRPARGADFRELRAGAWQDLEAELEARAAAAPPPGPAPRAALTQRALLEALLDYQWDRPEIASPTKTPRRRRGRRLLDAEADEAARQRPGHAVFLLAPCPRSRRDLLQFAGEAPGPRRGLDQLLPKRLQDGLLARGIALCWVDVGERAPPWDSQDHVGYWTVCELLQHVGGTVIPSETFSQDFARTEQMLLRTESKLLREHRHPSWISTLPTDSTLNRFLCPSEYEASFPGTEGTLFLPVEGKESYKTWTVTLEPLTMHQRHFPKPVRIFLQGPVVQWSPPMSDTVATENWMLQGPEEDLLASGVSFQHLVSRLTAEELHLVASVDLEEDWPPVTGVLSPFSANATILTVFRMTGAEVQRHFLHAAETESPQDADPLLSSVLNSVLTQMDNSLEDPADPAPVPEWVQQELGRTAPWSAAVVEKWFPRSNFSGASANLMESFWLLQAASSNKEESSRIESELTQSLAELYQRKAREESTVSNQEESRKKRSVPRTPVRQKMNTMCRSLKMLNVARLNMKAQKLNPDSSPDAAGEKGLQRATGGRAERAENRGRTLRSSKPKDIKTEEALLSYIHESYRKAVAAEEAGLYSCAQNIVSTVQAFLKSKGTKDFEISCLNQIRNNLFKTSKSLRDNLGKELDKEDKVRECQLQVFLRLELCQQCPSLRESVGDLEQVVEEATDLLRAVCLTEDSAYLAMFLEEILGLYISSIPKMLGDLYNSLGFVIPPKLASVLPADFFSDDSLSQESKSPLLSVPHISSAPQVTDSDQLEELRTRSAKKRKKNALTRHKSIAEVSQNLRQIEIPRASKRTAKNENCVPTLQQPPHLVKETVQEVTKVRRNLFNQQMTSPSKKSLKRALPRSHSVSAVEGLEYTQDSSKRSRGVHRLLTKNVAETPVHKQISRRLLHRQIQGRSSDPGPEVDVVEESPLKGDDEAGLRRSPRIKQLSLTRTNSGSFYSLSQPKSRSVQRVHSLQQAKSDQREDSPVQLVQTPKRLLFGAVMKMTCPSEKTSSRKKRPSGGTPGSESTSTYQTPKKSPQTARSSSKATPGKTPRTPQAPFCTPERLQGPPLETTPARRALCGGRLAAVSPHDWDSPWPQGTLLRGDSQAGGASPREESPRTRCGPAGRTLEFLVDSPQHPPAAPSPESPTQLLAWVPGAVGAGCECLAQGQAAREGASPDPKHQHPSLGPQQPGHPATLPSSPPHTPPCGSSESPPWTSVPQPLTGEASGLASTPHRDSQRAQPEPSSPAPTSKLGQKPRTTALGCTPSPAASPPDHQALPPLDSSPKRWGSPATSLGRDVCSPLHRPGDMQPVLVPEQAGDPVHGSSITDIQPMREGKGFRLPGVSEEPLPDSGVPVSPLSLGPSSPWMPSSLSLPSAAPQLEGLPACTPPMQAPASPQAYKLELGMSTMDLPRLRVQNRDPSAEAEPLDGKGPLPGGGAPSTRKSASKPETVHPLTPCLRPSHSTPGKCGGQIYICQSCTPTRCHANPSPLQAGTGVPWTPSPKPSGKSTPEAIQDWPRKKRAVDCGVGRAEGGLDPAGALAVPGPEFQEPGIELHPSHKGPPLLGDFELEGVCQLPELSPPWTDGSAPEDASWGQLGTGARKRLLSPQEEIKSQAKRACELLRGDGMPQRNEEGSPGLGRPLPSPDSDDVFVSGPALSPGSAMRSCLSASSLQALTQSPLLFQGRTPSTPTANTRGGDGDAILPMAEESPFSRALARRCPVRTYTRKKLLS